MLNYRWTVQNLDPQAVELLHSVKQDNPEFTLGELVSEAIRDWYENLEEQAVEEVDELSGCFTPHVSISS